MGIAETNNQIKRKQLEVKELYKKLYDEQIDLQTKLLENEIPRNIKMKGGTEEKEFWQYFFKDEIEEIVFVQKYHSGSFTISSVRPSIGIPICGNCNFELPHSEKETNTVFIKYDNSEAILNFLGEFKEKETNVF